MLKTINSVPIGSVTLVKYIADAIAADIDKGVIAPHEKLLSINEFSRQYKVARDTIEKAYINLKRNGYIVSVAGKGYYVNGNYDKRLKVLLVFNKLSYYKKLIYDGIIDVLSSHAKVELHIHHYDVKILAEILNEHQGKHDYYVIMPHFKHGTEKSEYLRVLQTVPSQKLFLLDKDITDLPENHNVVYQDFENDMYSALESMLDLFVKYNHLTVVIPPESNHPLEIISAAKRFCKQNEKQFAVVENARHEVLQPGKAYVVIEETELAELIKNIRKTNYIIGTDIGIIALNETILKELLNITVFSTDFSSMGFIVGQMLLNRQVAQVRNNFRVIRRQSF